MFGKVLFLLVISAATSYAQSSSNNTTGLDTLVKLHGITMVGAWGIVIPFGLSIVIMCKSVCPGKRFMIAHMTIMLIGMLLAGCGLLLILIHANFKWLTRQSLNTPHQLIGLFGLVALVLNPFLALVRPKENSKWRGVFDFAHGGTGIFLSLIPAFAAVVIGVNLLPGISTNKTRSRLIILLVTALLGYVLVLLALYNLYNLLYHKNIPAPNKVPGLIREIWWREDITEEEQDDNETQHPTRHYTNKIPLQSSPDAVCRVVVMTIALVPIVTLGLGVIAYIGLLK